MIAWKTKRRQEDGDTKMDLKETGLLWTGVIWLQGYCGPGLSGYRVIVDGGYLATEKDMDRLLSTRKRSEIFG